MALYHGPNPRPWAYRWLTALNKSCAFYWQDFSTTEAQRRARASEARGLYWVQEERAETDSEHGPVWERVGDLQGRDSKNQLLAVEQKTNQARKNVFDNNRERRWNGKVANQRWVLESGPNAETALRIRELYESQPARCQAWQVQTRSCAEDYGWSAVGLSGETLGCYCQEEIAGERVPQAEVLHDEQAHHLEAQEGGDGGRFDNLEAHSKEGQHPSALVLAMHHSEIAVYQLPQPQTSLDTQGKLEKNHTKNLC